MSRNFRRKGIAVVIETGELMQTICELLESFGYQAISAPTHALAAERALTHHEISLLTAAVPAPDESRAGVYLEEAAKRSENIAVVLMLSDSLEQSPGAPERSVKIIKPFGQQALIEAIERAERRARAT